MKKMTEGDPFLLIMSFALPLLGGNLFQQFYNIVDAAIVGRVLGGSALASVGATSSVQFLILGFCSGLAAGFGIPVAQQFGANQIGFVRSNIYHSFVLTGGFAVVLAGGCAFLCDNILRLLSTPADIYRNAYAYLFILFLGIPFTLLYNLLASVLRAVGDSKTPFLFLVFSTVLNIFLDLLCIMVLGLGCAGAAVATVFSQGVSALLCLRLFFKKYRELVPAAADRRWDVHRAGVLLSMGVPMGLQFSITAIGSMVMQSANNGLGSLYVSGFTAAQKIKQFALCPIDAFGSAAATFVSQNYGAGLKDRVRKGIRTGIVISAGYGFLIGLVLIFFGRNLSMIFMSAQHAAELDASAKYLLYMGYLFWVLGILIPVRMCVQGLGYSGKAIFGGVIEMTARSCVSLLLVPVWGFTAICITDQSAWITAAIYICIVLKYVLSAQDKTAEAG